MTLRRTRVRTVELPTLCEKTRGPADGAVVRSPGLVLPCALSTWPGLDANDVQCDIESPCPACQRRFGTVLAPSLCVRYEELARKVRNNTRGILAIHPLVIFSAKLATDFYSLKERTVLQCCGSNPIQTLILSHPLQRMENGFLYFPNAPTLQIKCQKYEGPSRLRLVCCQNILDKFETLRNQNTGSSGVVLSQLNDLLLLAQAVLTGRGTSDAYYIVENSFPTKEQLIAWGNFDFETNNQIIPEDVESALNAFLWTYKNKGPDIPFVSLVPSSPSCWWMQWLIML